jgi:hypothetical protein
MISLVVLADSLVELVPDELRKILDQLYPGQYLPPPEQGNFVEEGLLPGGEAMVNCTVPGASGLFVIHSCPGPYTEFSNFADHIADPSLRQVAEAQDCWLSVDLIQRHTDSTEQDAYRFIASLLAQIAPPDSAVLVNPSTQATIAFDAEVLRRIANGGPLF